MRPERFDTMTRSMAKARSRRGLLAAFAGGIGAALVGTLLRPPAGQAIQLCTVDSECPEDQRCASGTCVATLVAFPVPATTSTASPIQPSPGNKSQCCGQCSRKIEGCFNICYHAPDPANCYGGCNSRFAACSAACSPVCT